MTTTRTLAAFVALSAMLLAAGCAPAHHNYSDCCVPAGYCPPPPLPFVHYAACGCYTCAESKATVPPLVGVGEEVADTSDGDSTD